MRMGHVPMARLQHARYCEEHAALYRVWPSNCVALQPMWALSQHTYPFMQRQQVSDGPLRSLVIILDC